MSFVPSSLILDLDGTLIDSKPGILESFGTAVATVFPGQEFDLSTVVLGPPIQRMFQVSFPKASESEIEGLLRVFRGHYDREGSLHTRLYDGAWDVLTYCQRRGIALDIATNKPLHISTSILAHLKQIVPQFTYAGSDQAGSTENMPLSPSAAKAQPETSALVDMPRSRNRTWPVNPWLGPAGSGPGD